MASRTDLPSAALRISCATSGAKSTVADLSGSSTLGVEKAGPAGTECTDLARITLRGVGTIHTELGLTDFARTTAIVGGASSDTKAVAADLGCRALSRLGTGSTGTRGADLSARVGRAARSTGSETADLAVAALSVGGTSRTEAAEANLSGAALRCLGAAGAEAGGAGAGFWDGTDAAATAADGGITHGGTKAGRGITPLTDEALGIERTETAGSRREIADGTRIALAVGGTYAAETRGNVTDLASKTRCVGRTSSNTCTTATDLSSGTLTCSCAGTAGGADAGLACGTLRIERARTAFPGNSIADLVAATVCVGCAACATGAVGTVLSDTESTALEISSTGTADSTIAYLASTAIRVA
ncbi:hypothetical protein BKA56DRAFT_666246 [Ilyonectria sp. MPI-CAGE-AT-0026]|nr:hypothetical protein BKA56DRAFT_666246 [Ilyonectria sp. MPI-CAGE-AT-0026]